ncbi:uncharacterized protein K444DRAFT_620433 [Hyaloscypha bicolor E]|uniref:Uncharacterized protein n=1 Tax=Hyaloscypha bicolor E TaxID=1095630 RepID=A0A2J6SKK7_9HELO|nr:uncharacterized protein K444DRAFT_620433 [Hyaloscypha bicolor E]PMD51308.1 hypothetical protein K444DRAFT_620433 [Hyaloscypha bicolor E]
MRGGAGDPVIVYGPNGVGLRVQDDREDSRQAFLAAALRITGQPKTALMFEFVVDQYRNQEKNKDQPEKEFVKSFPVDQDNFAQTYNHYLESRLYNRQRDWPLVVRQTSDARSPTFTIPRRLKNPALPAPTVKQNLSPPKTGPILPPPRLSPSKKKQQSPPKSLPKLPPKKSPLKKKTLSGQSVDDADFPILGDKPPSQEMSSRLSSMAGATPGANERVVYSLDGKKSVVFKDCHKSFYQAALKVMGQKYGEDKIGFTVSQYNNAPVRECPPGKFAYIGSEKWPEGSANLKSYQTSIGSVMFKKADSFGNPAPLDYHKEWRVVVHPTQPRLAQYWPKESASDEMVDIIGYGAPSNTTSGKRSPSKQQQPGGGATSSKGQKPTPPSLKPPAAPTQPSGTTGTKTGYIHGFGGKILTNNTAVDFKRAGCQLLGEDQTSAFHFYFRMAPLGELGFGPWANIMVDHTNFEHIFHSEINPRIPASGDWSIFVSKWQLPGVGKVPLEPDKDKRDVVRIIYLKDTTYWKIPMDTETDCGINQLQDDFFGAMRVLFPVGKPRPQRNVQIGPLPFVDIGFGGMEVTKELWDKVRGDLKSQPGGLVYNIDLVNLGAQRPNSSQLIGIRLAGTHEYAAAQPTDYIKMQKEIDRMGKFLQDGQNPRQFKIWKTAEARESNGNSTLINYKPAATAAKEIKKFLEEDSDTTNCIWFRPEFPTISFKNITEGQKAKTFELEPGISHGLECVDLLRWNFNEFDQVTKRDIEINDADSQHRFILSEDTTRDQWRKHIYDWFSGKVIMVQEKKKKIVYQVEKSPPWGVSQPKESPVPLNTHTQNQQNNSANKTPTTGGLTSSTTMLSYQPPSNILRIPKERLLKQRVAPPKPVPWNEWQGENNRLDRLQRESYHTDQSVIEPGQQPMPPIYGPSRQTPLSVGTNMPEPYFWGTTPSDFAQKAAECQALRNSALERMSRCQLCDTSFPEYEMENIAKHLKAHQDALREVGKCPLCDCCWSALDKEQKKQHLWNHQTQGEQDLIRNFWQGFQCPICDEDLQSLSNEDVLAHMAEHPPGLLKFCDRCGLDTSSCLEAERDHHKKTCHETETAVSIVFCNGCGKNRSHETELDRQIHDSLCIPTSKTFCTVCGLHTTGLSIEGNQRHYYFHTPPGGPRKTFCKRCGKNLITMDAQERAAHRQECYLAEPHVMDTRDRIQELERRISQAKILKVHNSAEDARLSQKKRELEAREKDIKNLEAGLGIQSPLSAGLARSADTFTCPLLKPDGSVCNHQITITPCGGEFKAHYQHNCQPCGDRCGGSTLQELLRLYPELKAGSDKLQAAADKAKTQKANARPSQHRFQADGDVNDETSSTAEGGEVLPRPTTQKGKSPTKPPPSPSKTASKAKKPQPRGPPAAEVYDELDPRPDLSIEEVPGLHPTSEIELPETIRKGKTASSKGKAPGKTAAGSKRKKAVIEGPEDEAGGHHGKTAKGKKRQRTAREMSVAHTASSVLGSDSAEEDVLKEVSVPPVGLRRSTRTASGTPAPRPSMPSTVVREVGRPKAKKGEAQLEEVDEEDIMRSPEKRRRPHSPNKGVQ